MTTLLATIVDVGVATVQDFGRRGHQGIGVPASGAWHRLRYESACRLLGDAPEAGLPAVELLAGPASLLFATDAVVAVVGSASVTLGARSVGTGTVIHAGAGEVLSIESAGAGPAYLTVSGWSEKQTLGSCATDTFSGVGGRVLAVGDELSGATVTDAQRVGMFQRAVPEAPGSVRVLSFGDPPTMEFFARRWTVRRRSRSGVRLVSEGWTGPARSIESMPVVPGTIQVTPAGEAIVLGPDGGLTGGYPVVGVVASVDLDRMSLPGEGEIVSFSLVDAATAGAAYAERRARLLRSFANPRDLA